METFYCLCTDDPYPFGHFLYERDYSPHKCRRFRFRSQHQSPSTTNFTWPSAHFLIYLLQSMVHMSTLCQSPIPTLMHPAWVQRDPTTEHPRHHSPPLPLPPLLSAPQVYLSPSMHHGCPPRLDISPLFQTSQCLFWAAYVHHHPPLYRPASPSLSI